MKPLTLHPVSVLAGLALAGLAVLLSGATQTPTVTHHPRVEVVGQVPAAWWTYVRLNTPQPGCNNNPVVTYAVPPDRRFVVTFAKGGVLADGIDESLEPVSYYNDLGDRNGTRVVFQPGTLLSAYPCASPELWGYLEPTN